MSMTTKELEEIGRQLAALAEYARITIVECDAEITRVYPFAGALGDVAGRGGTDLRPVFEPDFLAAHRPQGVIYFTDGDGPLPDHAPALPCSGSSPSQRSLLAPSASAPSSFARPRLRPSRAPTALAAPRTRL